MPAKTPMQYLTAGIALPPLVAANGIAASTTANGTSIALANVRGRFITFALAAAASTGGIVGTHTCVVQTSIDNGSTFATAKQFDGTTDLGFLTADVSSGGALETNGFLIGTIDRERLKHATELTSATPTPITHVRLVWTSASASTAQVSAIWIGSHAPENAYSGDEGIYNADKLLALQHRST